MYFLYVLWIYLCIWAPCLPSLSIALKKYLILFGMNLECLNSYLSHLLLQLLLLTLLVFISLGTCLQKKKKDSSHYPIMSRIFIAYYAVSGYQQFLCASFFGCLIVLYMPTLCFSRGPWGALSPIPENNALAVNTQVCNWFLLFVRIICLLFHDSICSYFFV